jgi:hypothetical protein
MPCSGRVSLYELGAPSRTHLCPVTQKAFLRTLPSELESAGSYSGFSLVWLAHTGSIAGRMGAPYNLTSKTTLTEIMPIMSCQLAQRAVVSRPPDHPTRSSRGCLPLTRRI